MKPVVGAIHELPLPQVLEIETIADHTCIQQRLKDQKFDPNHKPIENSGLF
jgi:hypothetical protein